MVLLRMGNVCLSPLVLVQLAVAFTSRETVARIVIRVFNERPSASFGFLLFPCRGIASFMSVALDTLAVACSEILNDSPKNSSRHLRTFQSRKPTATSDTTAEPTGKR
jgi:hypothetical protein